MSNTLNLNNSHIPLTPGKVAPGIAAPQHSVWQQRKMSQHVPKNHMHMQSSRNVNSFPRLRSEQRVVSVLAMSDVAEVLSLSAELISKVGKHACNGLPCLPTLATVTLLASQVARVAADHANACQPDQFHCDNGMCIPEFKECDLDFDCVNGGDEGMNCIRPICLENEFSCGLYGKCISKIKVCNGKPNCASGWDEHPQLCNETYNQDDEDYFFSGSGPDFTETTVKMTTAPNDSDKSSFWRPITIYTAEAVLTLSATLYLCGVLHGRIKGKGWIAALKHPFSIVYAACHGSKKGMPKNDAAAGNTEIPMAEVMSRSREATATVHINNVEVIQNIYESIDYQEINRKRVRMIPSPPPRNFMTSNDAQSPSTDIESSKITRSCQQQSTNNAVNPLTPDTLLSHQYYQLEPDEPERSGSDNHSHSGDNDDSIRHI